MPEPVMPATETEITPDALILASTNAYSNQQLIDAFFDAANQLHNGDYQGLLLRAGLDIFQLAADRAARYAGPTLAHLPGLSSSDLANIHQSLLRQLQRRAQPGKVNAPDGLNQRSGPGRAHAVLHSLPFGSEVSILSQSNMGEEGEWLLVTTGNKQGWVFAPLVERNPAPIPVGGDSGNDSDQGGDNSGATSDASLPAGGSLEASTRLQPPANAEAHVAAAATTWNQYGGLIQAECDRLQFDPAVAVAILGVESSGRAFEGGRMVIRFENHIFLNYWGNDHRELFDRHFTGSSDGSQHRWRPDPNGEWRACHTNQATEWQVFEFARSLDERGALYAISMGAAQIMGFNHTSIGYATPQAMFTAFQADVRHQVAALFRFIEVNRLQEAVRIPDFVAFARAYNGSGQEAIYAPRMQRYYDAYRHLVEINRGRETARLPQPGAPATISADPELLAAWRKHVASGFANNQTLFQGILQGFLRPYWTTVWMYRILFALGVISFLLAASLAIFSGRTMTVFTFGGLSAIAILGFFFNRPLQALEQNLQFLTWLGIVYNSYWTRLTLLNNEATVQKDIDDVTADAIRRVELLVAEHARRSKKRPGLTFPGRGQQ